MPLKRVPVYEKQKCSCGLARRDKYARKPHVCYPSRDIEAEPEERLELHHRADLKAALIAPKELPKQASDVNTRGTATVNTLLPPIEPARNERPVRKHKGKVESTDQSQSAIHPETETHYESPQAIRDMDYSKSWAHAYREDGHGYGSHPSFDGCDDESNP